MKKIVLFILFCILSFQVYGKTLDAKISRSKIKYDINYNIKENKFFLTYYILTDIMDRLDLYEKLGREEVLKLTYTMVDTLSDSYSVTIEVKKYNGFSNLEIYMKPIITPDGATVIVMFTNYIMKDKRLVSGAGDNKDSYAIYYIIKNDKVFRSRYIYDAKKDEELKASGNISELADYYVMDDNDANDNEAKNMLIKNFETEKDDYLKYISIMTLFEYYMIHKEYSEAEKALIEGKKLYDSAVKNKKSFEMIYNLSSDMYYLSK
jgi:hypothetical protein